MFRLCPEGETPDPGDTTSGIVLLDAGVRKTEKSRDDRNDDETGGSNHARI